MSEDELPAGAADAARASGAASEGDVAEVVAPHRPIAPIVLAAACRRGADEQALTSPDPQVIAANAAMARLRVRI